MKVSTCNPARPSSQAFSLPEVLISVCIFSVMFISLYAGISQGFLVIDSARHNMRATQIMLEKVEVLRLFSWDAVTTPGYVPTRFSERLVPAYTTNSVAVGNAVATGSGVTYYGTTTIGPAPVDPAYTNTMRLVTISLTWTNGGVARTRTMQTLVAKYGIHEFTF